MSGNGIKEPVPGVGANLENCLSWLAKLFLAMLLIVQMTNWLNSVIHPTNPRASFKNNPNTNPNPKAQKDGALPCIYMHAIFLSILDYGSASRSALVHIYCIPVLMDWRLNGLVLSQR